MSVKTICAEPCRVGDPVEELVCDDCHEVRYIGSLCRHVAFPAVVRRRWDGRPLCIDCLVASRPELHTGNVAAPVRTVLTTPQAGSRAGG
jgi:hypothetical protein